MSRIEAEAADGLDRARAEFYEQRAISGQSDLTSSLTTTAAMAVFAAIMVVTAPSLGPVVEKHVFAGLADIEGEDEGENALETERRVALIELALANPPVKFDTVVAYGADGSPVATGSISRPTPAAHAARKVIADMTETPSPSTVQGLRGTIEPAVTE
ncbi:hypothetical protein ACKTEK_00490 [Tepidamorphus sp. 3E244]|uniref:hypothetical protein n=1 Tax=Tepidamorphus sp. 3E244 TaxID=3385498 RepID=UPI0038FC5B93